jgi:hypothetical protein
MEDDGLALIPSPATQAVAERASDDGKAVSPLPMCVLNVVMPIAPVRG